MKNKLLIVLAFVFIASNVLADDNWKKKDKILLTTYLIGETIDVLQTMKGLDEGYRELNPFIKDKKDLYVSAILTTAIIIWSANRFEDKRTEILVGCNTIKWSFVAHNHSVGIRLEWKY